MAKLQEWILSLNPTEYTIHQENDNRIICETDYAKAEINFHESDIIEFIITNKCSGDNVFYLHFQVTDEDRYHELYEEMITCLLNQKDKDSIKVLLSCSSGLTTSFFAEKLNEASELLSLDFTFNAVDIYSIYEKGVDYSVILLAPQVAFKVKEVQKVFKDKLVLAIPASIFGSYDAGQGITFLQDNYKQFIEQQDETSIDDCNCTENDKNILIIGALHEQGRTSIHCRIYAKGIPVNSITYIKDNLTEKDFEDIIRTFSYYDNIDMVAISIPALVADEYIEPDEHDHLPTDLKAYLEKKFNIPVLITNNSNAIAVGIYSINNKYKNFIFFSLPFGSLISGQGTVIDGKLIKGQNGFAGENKHAIVSYNFSNELEKNRFTTEGAAEIIAKELLPTICSLGPEAVYIRNKLTPDTEIIYKYLSYYMPKKYIPELIHVDNIEEFLFFGQLMMCANQK
ncbi:MAG: ROK family protein [Erysipelotrichaceae bacterium]|nr:ROK family protein [Erysipelotrichaceae bacterium]